MIDEILHIIFQNHSKTNPLVTASCYAFQLLTSRDFYIWHLVVALVKDLDATKTNELVYILVAWYCTYVSTNTIYNMPMLCNKPMVNGKPTVHTLFGENVAQLVSISLMAEGYRVVSELSKLTNNRSNVSLLMKVAYHEYYKVQQKSQIITSLESLTPEIIQADYALIQSKLYLSLLSTTFGLLGWEDDKVERLRNDLNEISDWLVHQTPISPDTIKHLSEQISLSPDNSIFLTSLLQKKINFISR